MILAIVQARIGSSRFPGKVIAPVLGKPLIQYTLERLSNSRFIKEIILATTDQAKDRELASLVKSMGYQVFRGSELDVLARYYHCYNQVKKIHHIQGIVRVTGDCPLVEIELIDDLIERFLNDGLDYANTGKDVAEGLDAEVMRPALLEEAFHNANMASEREHAALYITNRLNKYKHYTLKKDRDDSHYRITVDEPEDFQVVKAIIEHFSLTGQKLIFENIKVFLDKNPDIFSVNQGIIRNEGLHNSLENDHEV